MNDKDPFGKPAFTFRRSTATALLVGCVLSPALAADEDSAPRVSGRVLGQEEPVSAAQVFVWDVATYAVESVLTDQKGQFLFDSLPAGLYKIIAHKPGFVPAVEMLLRRNRDVRQFVELELLVEETGDVRQGETYWETRARIPADVLQKIRQLGLAASEPAAALDHAAAFEARMAAQGGVAQLGEGYGKAQLTDTSLGVRGTVGHTRVDVDGRYLELAATDESSEVPDGGVRSMSVALERPGEGRLSMATSSSDADEMRGDQAVGVDLTHYRLSWSGHAAGGSSDVSAQLIEENNYYNGGFEDGGSGLEGLPGASRTLAVEGSHSRDLTSHTSLETGVSFRQREGYSLLNPDGSFNEDGAVKDEVMGVFGVAGSQIQPRVLVEYGVYSAMREDELALMPHGGIVVKLGSDWQAQTSFAQRVEGRGAEDTLGLERFNAASFADESICHQIGEACYEVTFEREGEGNETLSVGAIHREFAETLRLYFSDDFFNRLESLLVVPGDELPEVRFRMVRQVSPKILAKLESNFASGGGGIFYATDHRAYQNEVRYLVASLDTRFQRTSTGVFLAFHHLEQALSPVSTAEEGSAAAVPELEIQRLQLMLTQDLSALANLATSLAVRFNMELSRGATPYQLTDDDEVQKKLTGGISVSF
jgi:hypothetical protein